MNYKSGQAILGKFQFKDGKYPEYNRTYLIVDTSETECKIINVSSISGKERKLLFPTNKEIKNYDPPFRKPSFAKLDSCISVSIQEMKESRILCGGECLKDSDLNEILDAM